jgi:hypothetical protein
MDKNRVALSQGSIRSFENKLLFLKIDDSNKFYFETEHKKLRFGNKSKINMLDTLSFSILQSD